jgi:hypothetical protein
MGRMNTPPRTLKQLRLDVAIGWDMVRTQRDRVAKLIETEAEPLEIEAARIAFAIWKVVQTENVDELRRLTRPLGGAAHN